MTPPLILWWIICVVAGVLYLVHRDARVEEGGLPSCLFTDPGPQQQVENGCSDCPFRDICVPRSTK